MEENKKYELEKRRMKEMKQKKYRDMLDNQNKSLGNPHGSIIHNGSSSNEDRFLINPCNLICFILI